MLRGQRCSCDIRLSLCWLFFFFQAEDGIRDLTVTGVQTCALPISTGGGSHAGRPDAARPRSPEGCRPRAGPYPPHTHAARRAAQDAGDAARPRWATTDRGASQGGQVTMSGRWVPGGLILLVLPLAGGRGVAGGPGPAVRGAR